jgi:glyoxylase-like metal-dependent hydrolase (beta-lactamase superfamily II)/rhodanese-related sulfurtransferase
MGEISFSSLSCEQVYDIWATEPHLLRLFDLRSEVEFRDMHVPGAIHIGTDKFWMNRLETEIRRLNGRLGVVVAIGKEIEESDLASLIRNYSDVVVMDQCGRWLELGKPIAGLVGKEKLIEEIVKTFKQGTRERQMKEQAASGKEDVVFTQLFEPQTSTYTYIIADRASKEAAIIDPVLETVDRDLRLIEEMGLRLMYVLDTHVHADHVTAAGEIRKRTGAKTAVSRAGGVSCVDIALEEGQELSLGGRAIRVIATPGHTDTCMTYAFEGMLFTGDALLIRGCGRTDFQQGSSEKLFASVREKLFKFPDETKVFPGHDYRGFTSSTIGLEKTFNPRLGLSKSKDDFVRLMNELKLANPKRIHEAVAANLACGEVQSAQSFRPQVVDGVPEITCEDLQKHLIDAGVSKKARLIDVRRPDEFNNELGHVAGAELVTLGDELTRLLEEGDRDEEIVFLCRSGGRSGRATAESIDRGYKKTVNMAGGMLRWNECKLPVIRK